MLLSIQTLLYWLPEEVVVISHIWRTICKINGKLLCVTQALYVYRTVSRPFNWLHVYSPAATTTSLIALHIAETAQRTSKNFISCLNELITSVILSTTAVQPEAIGSEEIHPIFELVLPVGQTFTPTCVDRLEAFWPWFLIFIFHHFVWHFCVLQFRTYLHWPETAS